MSEHFSDEVGIYCSLTDEVVLLTFNKELISMSGVEGYAVHSACCSKYAECGCEYYGLADECKSIIKQAENIVR